MSRFALALLAAAGIELAFGGILRPRHDSARTSGEWSFDGEWITTTCIGAPRRDEAWRFAPAPSELASRVRAFASESGMRDSRFAAWLVDRVEEHFAGVRVGPTFRDDAMPLRAFDSTAPLDTTIETIRDALAAKAPLYTLTFDYTDILFPECSVRGYSLGVVIGGRFLGVYREEQLRIPSDRRFGGNVLVAHGVLDAQLADPALLRVHASTLTPARGNWCETVTRKRHVPDVHALESAARRRGGFTVLDLHGVPSILDTRMQFGRGSPQRASEDDDHRRRYPAIDRTRR